MKFLVTTNDGLTAFTGNQKQIDRNLKLLDKEPLSLKYKEFPNYSGRLEVYRALNYVVFHVTDLHGNQSMQFYHQILLSIEDTKKKILETYPKEVWDFVVVLKDSMVLMPSDEQASFEIPSQD